MLRLWGCRTPVLAAHGAARACFRVVAAGSDHKPLTPQVSITRAVCEAFEHGAPGQRRVSFELPGVATGLGPVVVAYAGWEPARGARGGAPPGDRLAVSVTSAYVDPGQVARARRDGRVTDAAVQSVLRALEEPLGGPLIVWAWEEGGERMKLTVRPTGGR